MMINTDNLVSITDANQNFSRVARMVDENGAAIILKNNVPRYILMEFNQLEEEQLAGDEDIQEISKRLMAKNKHAYEAVSYTHLDVYKRQFLSRFAWMHYLWRNRRKCSSKCAGCKKNMA